MSVWGLLMAAAAITYATRVAAMAFLPAPSGRLAEVIDRLPAPLFGALAAVALLDSMAGRADWPTLAASAGAVVAARTRSLFVVLLAGLAAYGLVAWVTG